MKFRLNPRIRIRKRFTLQIVLGVLFGVVVGLFFGELAAPLEAIGIVYVRLLQMTILPYIFFSLIVGFGSLTYERAGLFARRAGVVLLLFWGIGLTIVALMATTFPDRESASFFNPGILSEPKQVSLVELFVPSNPFEALASSAIPAVVLFSILFGLALIAVPSKGTVLELFSTIAKTLQKVTGFVVKATPFGVFGLTASAFGTLNAEEIGKLEAFFLTYIAASLFLTFVVFPILMTTLTGFRIRDVIKCSQNALITAFTTGNLFVVLSLLMEDCRKLFKERFPDQTEAGYYVDILVPVTFNFPNMGKLIALLFIFFGAWYIGQPIPLGEYPGTVLTAMPVFFGGIDIAVPYMLSLKGLPEDLYSLYVVSGIVNGRFATLLACMELICFTLIAVSSLLGLIRFQLLRVLTGSGIILIFTLGMVLITGWALEEIVPSSENHADRIMDFSLATPLIATIHESLPEADSEAGGEVDKTRSWFSRFFSGRSDSLSAVSESVVDKSDSRKLKVGYIPGNLPWSFRNRVGDLVGYDIEAAQRLSGSLGVALHLYPVTFQTGREALESGALDILMSGIPITLSEIDRVTYSENYLSLRLALLVSKEKAKASDFDPIEALKLNQGTVIGYVHPSPFLHRIHTLFPRTPLVPFDNVGTALDKVVSGQVFLLVSAEAGSAWTMANSGISVFVPPARGVFELAYPLARDDRGFQSYINQWLLIEKQDGAIQARYDYWILGRARVNPAPRWSILQNMLGWTGND